ncbi:FAD dependent oxidoreductase superfamily protein [Cladophialophora carrionii]|uniref:FAD dependent oxidoreductase superfamily protein n=1 Tax=Cladophialophora carrionii TaxID=86049 RepID=A0A1C1CZH9_9EURO|nr:FAD dependent oxidoreductase superfamily protein [Cladophialophora carrionii]
MPLPHPKPMPSYWLSYDSNLQNHRTTEALPPEADVVVIGAGYTGAATAYHILEKSSSKRPSVVILEARCICSGATARNGGHIKPDVYFNAVLSEKMFGPQMAQQLTRFEMQQVFDVKRLVEKEQIDCDFELTRAIDVFVDPRVAKQTIAAFEEMKASGYRFADDLHFIQDPKKAEQVSGVKGALAAFTFTAGTVWPYKLVCHLLRRCLEWGANLQANTPVTKIAETADDRGRWTVTTPRGAVRAKKVVFATNAYLSTILPEFQDKITPARGVACRIAVAANSKKPAPHLNNSYSIRYGPQEYDYLISRTDGSVVVGGAKQAVLLDETYWHNNINDSELIPGAEKYFTGYMQRMFHGWEDSGAEITDIWTGVMGYSSDLVPWVGDVPGRPGIFVNAGFTGHGMPRILGCSEALAAVVRGDVHSLKDTSLPAPYWITEDRLRAKESVTREYMAGSRPSL